MAVALCAINGYAAVPVMSSALHYLYVRLHEGRSDNADLPEDRTLFVANVPPEYTENTLKDLFKAHGKVQAVKISSRADQRAGNTTAPSVKRLYHSKFDEDVFVVFAHVIFKNADSLPKILTVKPDAPIVHASHLRQRSISTLLQQHAAQYPDPRALKEEVDKSVAAYEAAEEKRKKAREEARNKPDEDGWTTVSYGKRRAEIEGTDVPEKKKKPAQMLNFYRWQQREARRDQIADLRRKFEDDKQKIALMRMSRKFRPY